MLPSSMLHPSPRIIISIRGAPAEYGVDEAKLRPFEKLLQTLEGKLMEGKIFEVSLLSIPCIAMATQSGGDYALFLSIFERLASSRSLMWR